MALRQGIDDVILDPRADHGPRPAARSLQLCTRSCIYILQGTFRGSWANAWVGMIWPSAWANAWVGMIWPSSCVSRRCGMLDFYTFFLLLEQDMQRFWGGVGRRCKVLSEPLLSMDVTR
eukprot:364939-Chlamydomonas_euryale.AAC.5